MNKLNNSVLDKISENNNEYRGKLRNLNNQIEEKTTSFVGELVTLSNYVIDFSNSINKAKDDLVMPINRIVESYVIKDLRGVETVNEQFVMKINDKLEDANITNAEEKDKFIDSLNSLLNNKYLEIVKIKRNDFCDTDGKNAEIEDKFNNFINYISSFPNVNVAIFENTINTYKESIYSLISSTLKSISDLYLSNFVDGIMNGLNAIIELNNSSITDDFKPFTPNVDDIEIPSIPKAPITDEKILPISDDKSDIELPEIPSFSSINNTSKEEEEKISVSALEVPKEEPITVDKDLKKQYDVEEILKIAKSPVVSMPSDEEMRNNSFTAVEPIIKSEEKDNIIDKYNEDEIASELINRLTYRLDAIKEKQQKLDNDEKRLDDDEAFVNSLIDNSNKKQLELDEIEKELNKKKEELKAKEEELNRKINDVLPFANAVMNVQKES